jgi:hypothetical protein
MSYRRLDPSQIIATAERLAARIGERFPGSGLARVGAELVVLSRDIARDAAALQAPILWLRILIAGIILAGASIFLFVGTIVSFSRLSSDALQGCRASSRPSTR